MTLTWGFFIICLLIALAIAAIFWLINHKFPEAWKMWANVIVAGILIIILIIWIVNISGGSVNLNAPIRVR